MIRVTQQLSASGGNYFFVQGLVWLDDVFPLINNIIILNLYFVFIITICLLIYLCLKLKCINI